MSTISGLGGSSGAWAGMQAQRAMRAPPPQGGTPPQGGMPDDLFSEVDSDSDGSVNASELSELLSKMPGSTGSSTSANSEELLAQWDSDGSGSLSQTELGEGLKAMMPPPPPRSTLEFAQQRNGGASEGLMSLDADQDGRLSASEFGLNEASSERMKALFAAMDSDGDQQVSGTEVQSFEAELKQQVETAKSTQGSEKAAATGEKRLSELVGQLVQRYLQAGTETATPALSLSA